jgi:hypothetical protein
MQVDSVGERRLQQTYQYIKVREEVESRCMVSAQDTWLASDPKRPSNCLSHLRVNWCDSWTPTSSFKDEFPQQRSRCVSQTEVSYRHWEMLCWHYHNS